MKLGITGSRTITDFDFIPYFMMRDEAFRAFCREHCPRCRKITLVITGGARGADTAAFQTARSLGIRVRTFPPDRKKYPGRQIMRAFQDRNRQIVDSCDVLLAVWDGTSHGTRNTLLYAQKINRPVFLIGPEG